MDTDIFSGLLHRLAQALQQYGNDQTAVRIEIINDHTINMVVRGTANASECDESLWVTQVRRYDVESGPAGVDTGMDVFAQELYGVDAAIWMAHRDEYQITVPAASPSDWTTRVDWPMLSVDLANRVRFSVSVVEAECLLLVAFEAMRFELLIDTSF